MLLKRAILVYGWCLICIRGVVGSFEDNLIEWYGPAMAMFAFDFEALRPDLTHSAAHAFVRSIKVAAFFESVNELNGRITNLLRKEISEEYATQWSTEAQGHILGSVDKITSLQNWADNKHVQSICETGFNVGYSAINFLLANPNATFISFDIFMNRFGPYAVRALQEMFPSRSINVIAGDSTRSVPNYLRRGLLSCDLVFTDGGTPADRKQDIANFVATANQRTVPTMHPSVANISFNIVSSHMEYVDAYQLSNMKDAQSTSASTSTNTMTFRTLLIVPPAKAPKL